MPSLRREFKLAVQHDQNSRLTPALMARDDGGGSFTATVPGVSGFVYVRIGTQGTEGLSSAMNPYSVSTTGDTPIWLDVDQGGNYIVAKVRYTG